MEIRNLIGGEWVEADSGERIEVRDPADDELVGVVPSCGGAETARAIDAAAGAFEAWSRRPAHERSSILRRVYDFMRRDEDRLAALMTREQGKPLAEALGEVRYAASFIEWAAEEGKRIGGEIIPASSEGKRIIALRQPAGVVATITPWNFPAAMITRKIGPALAVGCTVVCKPASQTPLSALAIAELCVEAGIPEGVVNVVTGGSKPIAEAFFGDTRVRHVSFTGSTEVGRVLIKQSAENIVKLSLELGGHAPFLVFDDADLDRAVEGLMASKFRNAGQTCICANRVLVQDGVYDEFRGKLERAVGELRLGPGLEEGVKIGPLIDDDGVEKAVRHVEDARDKGAKVVCGGKAVRPREGLAERWVEPTILDGATPEMACWNEETFGPVVPLARFRTEKEAIERANDSPYGLAAYFYARDASRVVRVAEGLHYGIVGANDGAPSTAQAPFGGVKESGYGREGGRVACEEFTEIKYISLGVG